MPVVCDTRTPVRMTSAHVCVCVCVCVRERERVHTKFGVHTLVNPPSSLPDKGSATKASTTTATRTTAFRNICKRTPHLTVTKTDAEGRGAISDALPFDAMAVQRARARFPLLPSAISSPPTAVPPETLHYPCCSVSGPPRRHFVQYPVLALQPPKGRAEVVAAASC